MNHRKLIYLLFVLFTISSCHKDSLFENEEDTTKFTATVVEEITGKIVGYVYDENNQPVEDALVQIYSASTKTNKFGVFVFDKTKMDKQGTYITVRKSGFVLGSDLVYAQEKVANYSRIGLLALETNKTFTASEGGELAISGGGKISFPANAISYLDGGGYNGKVYVTAKLLSPSNNRLEEIMPGGLIGDAANGATVAMGSAGMVAVELRDDKGEELNLTSGQSAKITIPATTVEKPATIALWSFDESKGRWKEEGTAKLVEDHYEAEVKHFSFWNCDAPFPLVDVCGKVVDQAGKPIANVWVSVQPEGLWASAGITNSDGVFCGKMPKGVKLTFKVSTSYCGTVQFEKTIDPLYQATILDPFVIENLIDNKSLKINGQILCNGTPIQNGYLVVKVNGQNYVYAAVGENNNIYFNLDLTYLLCNNSIDQIQVFAFDNDTGKSSKEVTITLGPNPIQLTLDVCEVGCDFDAVFDYDCDDILSIQAHGGSGNFQYLWADGTEDDQIKLQADSSFGTYCVTITDTGSNGCTKTFCKQLNGELNVQMEAGCWGFAQAYPYGGIAPYTYLWSNGSTLEKIEVISQGTYCVTVTDVAGCTAVKCQDVTSDPVSMNTNYNFCNANIFSFETSSILFAKIYPNNNTQPYEVPNLESVNVFESGFNFRVLLYNGQCESYYSIELPRATNWDYNINNPSCSNCKDGWIEYIVESDCNQCTVGDVKIFAANDLSTDLSDQNTAKTLGKGFYYVVIEDAGSGCYIGVQKVELKI